MKELKEFPWGPDIILDEVTGEMFEWLDENCPEKYRVAQHMVRFKYAGPSVPLDECERCEGMEIYFQDEEDAMAFKLRWL